MDHPKDHCLFGLGLRGSRSGDKQWIRNCDWQHNGRRFLFWPEGERVLERIPVGWNFPPPSTWRIIPGLLSG